MKEEIFSAEQSLQVIQSMIQKAKQGVADNSFYLLLWGWLIFIAALLNFILMKFTGFERPYLVWNLMWIGAVASIVKGIKDSRKIVVKTFVGETMKYFGISQVILYIGLAFFFGKYDLWTISFPLYILIYAVTCFFMGILIQFPLLMWTGLLCLPIMVISAYVSFDWQLLLLAMAILISYIIPGHVLSTKEKIQNN
ncbi:MAG TPA: hypothetical protein VJ765_02665 [Chitinophagaceae bacterium]|nr:hypothetical protein [Chitinophagaceae bacterium]